MKKTFMVVFLTLIMLLSGTLTAYAEGSGNVDGGGGGLNQGTKAYNWPGNSYQGGACNGGRCRGRRDCGGTHGFFQ